MDWRNDPETRKSSHNVSEVNKEEHVSWLTAQLENSKCRIYVAEQNGVPIGTVRADYSGGVWELSWTTAPSARGKGVAKRMVAILARLICDPIRAEVKVGNVASARIAENAGMELINEVEGILHYGRGMLKNEKS